ncbi:hypothetical protein IT575_06710 [bacterium]|nr:hypothetical protein [bacterium]
MPCRFILTFVLPALLLLGACNKAQDSTAGSSKDSPAGTSTKLRNIAVVFDATESDPWASEMIGSIGNELGIDPWKSYSQSGHLDVYGPYEAMFRGQRVKLSIALCGLSGVADLLSQQVLGEEARNWIVALKPDIVWLDGDQAQFMIGRELPAELPIVFSGTVGERDFYYDGKRQVTGVYQRYSLPNIISEIWRDHPEAASLALLSDASTAGQAQREQFRDQLELLKPGSGSLEPPPAIDSWQMLHKQLREQKEAEAIVVCGFQPDSAPPGLSSTPCPAGILDGVGKTIVLLGPSLLDDTGALSLRLVPFEHAKGAMDLIEEIFKGEQAAYIEPFTPMQMQRFVSR